jgi:hypothetical protein
MRLHKAIVIFAMCGVSACSGQFNARTEAVNTSICQINDYPKNFLDKTVVVAATHKMVIGYVDYLTDQTCSSSNTLEISDWARNASVRSYELAVERECAGKGLCTLSANVVVELRIEVGTGGHINYGPTTVGRLSRVISYSFVRD